jgi:two-component system response regulator NreC
MLIKVLLADEHPAAQAELRTLVEREADIQVVAGVSHREGLLRLTRELKPDIVVMDTSVSGAAGYQPIRELRAACAETRILVLSMYADHHFARGMLRAGASGYLLTDCASDELIPAIRAVNAGECYISPLIDQPSAGGGRSALTQ